MWAKLNLNKQNTRAAIKHFIRLKQLIDRHDTHRMYMITPKDHMSHDLSYFSGPSTSGAECTNRYRKKTTQQSGEWRTYKSSTCTHTDNMKVNDNNHIQKLCLYLYIYSTDTNAITKIPTTIWQQTLTDIIWSVTGSLEGVVQCRLLSEAKVCQFEDRVSLFSGVQQVLWLEREAKEEKKFPLITQDRS